MLENYLVNLSYPVIVNDIDVEDHFQVAGVLKRVDRLLHRALFWAASKEDALSKWFSTNINRTTSP